MKNVTCDICDQPVPDERVTVQHPTAWSDLYDICDDCWAEHFEPVIARVAQKRPTRIRDSSE